MSGQEGGLAGGLTPPPFVARGGSRQGTCGATSPRINRGCRGLIGKANACTSEGMAAETAPWP